MRGLDTSGIGLDDIGNILGMVLGQGGDQLDPHQRQELQERQQRVQQAQRYGDPSLAYGAGQDKDGFLDDILRIAGPAVAGYAIRMLQERLTRREEPGFGQAAGLQQQQPQAPVAPRYGSHQEGDVIHRSDSRGQTVQETD